MNFKNIKYFIFFILLAANCTTHLTCSPKKQTTRTSEFPEKEISSSETWKIQNVKYTIENTGIILYPTGERLFILKCLVDFDVNQGNQRQLAKMLAKYAYDFGYYERAKNSIKEEQHSQLGEAIGVSLIKKSNILEKIVNLGDDFKVEIGDGYRYVIEISEIDDSIAKQIRDSAQPGQIRLRVIVVGNNSQANEILSHLKTGTDFSELAIKYSTGPSKYNGGDIGFLFPSDIDDRILKAIEKLKVGEFSNIIRTESGFCIIQLIDIKK